jgi:enoyl-CoA hydratase
MSDLYAQFEALNVTQEGRLLRIELNRPDKLNSVSEDLQEELISIWPIVRRDESVGAVLLTGAGRSFSAGGDIKMMAERAASGFNGAQFVGGLMQRVKLLIAGILDVEQPIVCAVQGHAMGLGATLALCSDVTIMADDAVIADSHVVIGLVAGDGGTLIWPLLMPINKAKYYLMTGDRISGPEAAEMGMVFKSVPADELTATAEEIALKLANSASLAVRWTKYSINQIIRDRVHSLLDISVLLEGASYLSDDHRNSTAAFVDRRPAEYTGS